VVTRYHAHIKNLLDLLEGTDLKGASFDWAHGARDSKERAAVRKAFKAGEIDVLVASNIFNRGKNLPRTKAIINAASGTSETQILQGPIGRATRLHESKKQTLIIDYYDEGEYLELHSKRRVIFYKNEKLPVNELYKRKKK
jgi:superfamily II DNA or RNA helicase